MRRHFARTRAYHRVIMMPEGIAAAAVSVVGARGTDAHTVGTHRRLADTCQHRRLGAAASDAEELTTSTVANRGDEMNILCSRIVFGLTLSIPTICFALPKTPITRNPENCVRSAVITTIGHSPCPTYDPSTKKHRTLSTCLFGFVIENEGGDACSG
jgi:hypothetical protein